MKKILLILLLINFQSCQTTRLIQTQECKQYYQFIKDNWVKHDDFTYSFKGNPSYWHNDIYKTYVNSNCLIGLRVEEIRIIFGEPTKVYKSKDLNMCSYCIDKYCQNYKLMGGRFLQFNLDENDKVIEVFTSPGDSNIPDY